MVKHVSSVELTSPPMTTIAGGREMNSPGPQLDNGRSCAVTASVGCGKACGGGAAHLLKNDRGAEAGDFTALAEPVGQEGVQVVEILHRDVKEEVVASGEHEHVEDFRQAAGEALEGVDDGATEGSYLY
ncbi:hypothetical protein GCM10027200_08330 [Lentzea nigeriaca]